MKVLRTLAWWITSVMGDHDYERHVESLRRRHPDCPVPSEKEYWRARYAEADAHPASRCC